MRLEQIRLCINKPVELHGLIRRVVCNNISKHELIPARCFHGDMILHIRNWTGESAMWTRISLNHLIIFERCSRYMPSCTEILYNLRL